MLIKKAIVILFILLNSCAVFGQIYKNFLTMHHVYEDWLTRQACDNLYYEDNVSPNIIDETIKQLSSERVFPLNELYMGKETKPLIITDEEQRYIITELKKLKAFKWPVKLFKNSKRISQNQIPSVFAVADRYSDEKYQACAVVYSFSRPIFIRNGTICLYIDQEIYPQNNLRLVTNFGSKVNGHWGEYANVFTQFEKSYRPRNNKVEQMADRMIEVQNTKDSLESLKVIPETIDEFGMRALSIFKTRDSSRYYELYPTIEPRIIIAQQNGIVMRRTANDSRVRTNQVASLLQFSYKCLTILDTAKALKINWAKVVYSDAKEKENQLTEKNRDGNSLTIKILTIKFRQENREFELKLEGVYFIRNTWKTLSVSGLKEVI